MKKILYTLSIIFSFSLSSFAHTLDIQKNNVYVADGLGQLSCKDAYSKEFPIEDTDFFSLTVGFISGLNEQLIKEKKQPLNLGKTSVHSLSSSMKKKCMDHMNDEKYTLNDSIEKIILDLAIEQNNTFLIEEFSK